MGPDPRASKQVDGQNDDPFEEALKNPSLSENLAGLTCGGYTYCATPNEA